MQKNYNRQTIEHLKVQLQYSIQELLTNTQPDEDDIEIISRAMTYIVTSHNSFAEQYFRITEYLYAMTTLQNKYSYRRKMKTQHTTNHSTIPLFTENENPF